MPDKAYIATYIVSKTLLFFCGPINYMIWHGIDNKLNEIKHSAQLVTLSAQRLAYGSMSLSSLELDLDPIFLSREMLFRTVRSAKLSTDITILMPGTDYFGETALKQDIAKPYFFRGPINDRISHGIDSYVSA